MRQHYSTRASGQRPDDCSHAAARVVQTPGLGSYRRPIVSSFVYQRQMARLDFKNQVRYNRFLVKDQQLQLREARMSVIRDMFACKKIYPYTYKWVHADEIIFAFFLGSLSPKTWTQLERAGHLLMFLKGCNNVDELFMTKDNIETYSFWKPALDKLHEGMIRIAYHTIKENPDLSSDFDDPTAYGRSLLSRVRHFVRAHKAVHSYWHKKKGCYNVQEMRELMKGLTCVKKAASHAVETLHLREPGQDLLEKERARRGKLSRKILDLYPENGEEDVEPIQFSERILRMHEAGSKKKRKDPPPSSEEPVKRRARDPLFLLVPRPDGAIFVVLRSYELGERYCVRIGRH